jgi:hypothetical protein
MAAEPARWAEARHRVSRTPTRCAGRAGGGRRAGAADRTATEERRKRYRGEGHDAELLGEHARDADEVRRQHPSRSTTAPPRPAGSTSPTSRYHASMTAAPAPITVVSGDRPCTNPERPMARTASHLDVVPTDTDVADVRNVQRLGEPLIGLMPQRLHRDGRTDGQVNGDRGRRSAPTTSASIWTVSSTFSFRALSASANSRMSRPSMAAHSPAARIHRRRSPASSGPKRLDHAASRTTRITADRYPLRNPPRRR